MIKNLLSIAGSDPSGGAGIQADLKTFAALGCHGMAVVTALTAQNTQGVAALHLLPPDFVAAQIEAIFADIEVHGVKIGMLGSGAIAAAVAKTLASHAPLPIVLDPILAASSGDDLATTDLIESLRTHLWPLATLVTPNLPEAARLVGDAVPKDLASCRCVAEDLRRQGVRAVLLKGGHLEAATADDLFLNATTSQVFSAPWIATRNTHGTGCTLSSAIAANLAHGLPLPAAIAAAKTYLTGALHGADRLAVGQGQGPLHHFFALWPSDDAP